MTQGKMKGPQGKSVGPTGADTIRQKINLAFAKRHAAARAAAVGAFEETGVPELFQDADLVVKELDGIRRYLLAGCPDGVPRPQSFTIGLIKRMLTSCAQFQYEAWVVKKGLSDETILSFGDFRDEDSYLFNFCFEGGQGTIVEKRKAHVRQRKVQKSFADYVKTAAVYAKEIKADKAVNLWLRAYEILVLYNPEDKVPYRPEAMEKVFAYIDEASTETYVAWMCQRLPTMEQFCKETKA